ncbi:putative RNA methyltransferase [Anaeromassilibacillus sp. SJQ-1]|uniref:putative RNA methyltransferase n=1 Tax=Anaeromassilibacillus sp. SJQ-1 TaxID=3375419 RepID=UPI003989CB5D
MFICPVCGDLLQRGERTYSCPKGHSYDLAKEGYVYLLAPNKEAFAKTLGTTNRWFLPGALFWRLDCISLSARN